MLSVMSRTNVYGYCLIKYGFSVLTVGVTVIRHGVCRPAVRYRFERVRAGIGKRQTTEVDTAKVRREYSDCVSFIGSSVKEAQERF